MPARWSVGRFLVTQVILLDRLGEALHRNTHLKDDVVEVVHELVVPCRELAYLIPRNLLKTLHSRHDL